MKLINILMILLVCCSCGFVDESMRCGHVTSIGGCDSDGLCGVSLLMLDKTDKFVKVKYPSVGKYVCKVNDSTYE